MSHIDCRNQKTLERQRVGTDTGDGGTMKERSRFQRAAHLGPAVQRGSRVYGEELETMEVLSEKGWKRRSLSGKQRYLYH